MPSIPEMGLRPHTVPTPYVDRKRLLFNLRARFGADKFKVQLRLNQWTLFLPTDLSEHEVLELCG
ncbi:hypothetical protein BDZ45DRAFT_680676 [Acephala macrosclerotiorum]|nr:hypothetical protein BDZ45DRAFT_680676 [Acephala macrosclerotiorum]